MKHLVFALWAAVILVTSVSCETINSYPKFQVDERVIVTEGFYEGCFGKIIGNEYNPSVSKDKYFYTINLEQCKGTLIIPRITVGETMIKDL